MIGLLSGLWLRIKLGVMVAGAVAVAIFSAWRVAVNKGRADERSRQDKASLDNLRKRNAGDDAVRKMDDARVRSELARWVPDDGGK